jgi:carotenoid cleavage dioxygenase
MKDGGEHWQWDPKIPCYFGVLPRHDAKGDDVKWFRSKNSFPGHVANAYETPDGNIIVDLPIGDQNVFFWWKDAEGNAPIPQEIFSQHKRFTINPKSENLDLPEPVVLISDDNEFPRIDDRYAMTEHKHTFLNVMDPKLGTDFPAIAPVMGGGYPLYNALGHLNLKTGTFEKFFVGPKSMVQEPIFVPRSENAPEGDGFVMALVNRYETMTSDIVILDTRDWQKPVAEIKLPVRLRAGLHGNWVDSRDLKKASTNGVVKTHN